MARIPEIERRTLSETPNQISDLEAASKKIVMLAGGFNNAAD